MLCTGHRISGVCVCVSVFNQVLLFCHMSINTFSPSIHTNPLPHTLIFQPF